MKIYISIPITGQDIEQVEARLIFAKAVLERKGHTPVSPLDVSDNPDASYAEHMGRDISALLDAGMRCRAVPRWMARIKRLHFGTCSCQNL